MKQLMSGRPQMSRALASEYRICIEDAVGILDFVIEDIGQRLCKGETLHIDRLGSFSVVQKGKKKTVEFRPAKNLLAQLNEAE